MNICVHTAPGRKGEAKPRVFYLGARRLIVAGILDSWSDGIFRYYEVRCEDGRRFLLRCDGARNCWELAGVYAASLRLRRKARVAAIAPPPAAAAPTAKSAAAAFIARWWR